MAESGNDLFLRSGNRKTIDFLRRKSEFQICCGSGIMVNMRAENGIRSQWWERNRHFCMADLLPQRAEGEAAKFREGRRVIRKCNHFFHVFETK